MMKQNYEYSCQMFRTAIDLVPDNLLWRQSLRAVTEKRYNNNGTGAAMAGMKLRSTKSAIQQYRRQGNWMAVAKLCEDGLAINPWGLELNANLGDAAHILGWVEIARWCRFRADGDDGSGAGVLAH